MKAPELCIQIIIFQAKHPKEPSDMNGITTSQPANNQSTNQPASQSASHTHRPERQGKSYKYSSKGDYADQLINVPSVQESSDTNNGLYASGTYVDDKLQITVGGVNGNAIKNGMSGGWQYDFETETAGSVEITFDYELTISNQYESNEYGEVVVALDWVDVAVKRLTGKGGTYQALKTGETVVFNYVPAGSHTITVGGHNNQKTSTDEYSTIKYDYVKVSLEETGE
eukprot:scaffold1605_cov158-Amphora_coffeaeformis.AAC.5